MKPVIVLQSDFSNTWSAVSSMKAIIKTVDRQLDIEDGTHEIDPFNIWMGAQELRDLVNVWPDGTVFVSVVDPGVGTDRKASVARLDNGSYVVSPDNGSFSLIKDRIIEIRQIDEKMNRSHHNEKVAVFDGRDLFAYCAARLASGIIDYAGVGPSYDRNEIVVCQEAVTEPVIEKGNVETFVTHVLPWYGGIRAAVTNEQFVKEAGFQTGDRIHVVISHKEQVLFDETVPFVRSFGDVKEGMPLVYEGSSLLVSIDLNRDNFAEKYGIHAGLEWKIRFEKNADIGK